MSVDNLSDRYYFGARAAGRDLVNEPKNRTKEIERAAKILVDEWNEAGLATEFGPLITALRQALELPRLKRKARSS